MKYFIKRDVCADFGAFEIYDETGIEKYLAEFSKSKRSRKIIIHSADEIFVKIRCLSVSNIIACNINAGGKKMRILMGVNRNELVCICSGVNWKICGNIAQKVFPYRMLTIRLLQCKREYFRVRKVMNSMCIRRQMNCYQYLLRFV